MLIPSPVLPPRDFIRFDVTAFSYSFSNTAFFWPATATSKHFRMPSSSTAFLFFMLNWYVTTITHIIASVEHRRKSRHCFLKKKDQKTPSAGFSLKKMNYSLLMVQSTTILRRSHKSSNRNHVCQVPCCISTELTPKV